MNTVEQNGNGVEIGNGGPSSFLFVYIGLTIHSKDNEWRRDDSDVRAEGNYDVARLELDGHDIEGLAIFPKKKQLQL